MMVLKMFFETIFIHIGTFSPVLIIKKPMKCLVDVERRSEAFTITLASTFVCLIVTPTRKWVKNLSGWEKCQVYETLKGSMVLILLQNHYKLAS